jgi:long-chain acyl-CoA synthetase
MNIAQHVEEGSRQAPQRPAILFEGRSISYAELDLQAARAAAVLRDCGVGCGDRVALLLPNIPNWVVCYLAVQRLGAIAVSVNTHLKAPEIAFILSDSGARVLLTSAALYPQAALDELPRVRHVLLAEGERAGVPSLDALAAQAEPAGPAREMRPDDPAALVYTSGTTGVPKGALLSHNNVVQNMRAKRRYMGVRPDDRLLLFLPLYHCFGQNAVLNAALASGATVVLQRQFEPAQTRRALLEDGVTMFFGVPTTFIMLLGQLSPQDMRGVRYCLSAAAVLPRAVEERWHERFGLVVHQGYGLTESSPFASYNHPERYRPGSIGVPIDGVEMKIVSPEDGRELPPGQVGEIVIRGHNVMLGYWNRPSDTAAAIRDGWLHTGDMGRVDDEGCFYIEDRLKDMINVGGLKVYPAEVEHVLLRHPAVAEAAVYGAPDPVLGEQVRAQVVLRAGYRATPDELGALCRAAVAGFKVPTQIVLVDALPKSPVGKVLKRVLRDGQAARPAAAPDPDLLQAELGQLSDGELAQRLEEELAQLRAGS